MDFPSPSPNAVLSREQASRDLQLINAAINMDDSGDGDEDDDALFAVHRAPPRAAVAHAHATPPPSARPPRTPSSQRSGSLHPQPDAAIPLSPPSSSFPASSLSSSSPSTSSSSSSPSLHSAAARQAALDRLRTLESSATTTADGGGALLRVAASPTGRATVVVGDSDRAAIQSPAPPPTSSLSSSLRRSLAPADSSSFGGGGGGDSGGGVANPLSSSLVGALRLLTAAAPLPPFIGATLASARAHANHVLSPPPPPHAAAHTDGANLPSSAVGSSPFALRGSLNQSMMAALAASASAPPRLNSARK
jgi:hypothetical protein